MPNAAVVGTSHSAMQSWQQAAWLTPFSLSSWMASSRVSASAFVSTIM